MRRKQISLLSFLESRLKMVSKAIAVMVLKGRKKEE
jgi:hypothetical protein